MSTRVAPVRLYLTIFVSLLLLTAATVAASYKDLGHAGNIALGLAIAVVKALLVALFFMHLKHDGKEDISIRYFAIFPLILLVIFVAAIMPDIGLRQGDGCPAPVELRQNRPAEADVSTSGH